MFPGVPRAQQEGFDNARHAGMQPLHLTGHAMFRNVYVQTFWSIVEAGIFGRVVA